jgi:hypothetical protein
MSEAASPSDRAIPAPPAWSGDALDAAGHPAPATVAAADPSRPYAPSWVNRLIRGIERLPGPTWAAYAVLLAIAVLVSNSLVWVNGNVPWGQPDPAQTFWGAFNVLAVALVHYLDGVARRAFDAFRPALTLPEAEVARLRHDLTVVPARPALVLLVLAAVMTLAYYALDPESSQIVGLSPAALAIRAVVEIFFGAIIFVLVYHSLRQMRAVGRIHDRAVKVDLFRPAPLFAFSVLTSRTAIAITLIILVPLPVGVDVADPGTAWVWIPWLVGGIVVAAVVFALPLQGMQRRIVAEKRHLQAEVGRRLAATIDMLHAAIDAGDLSQAGAMNDAFDALVKERDVVDRLPTWPWRPGTVSAVATAIGLPIMLFVTERILGQVL